MHNNHKLCDEKNLRCARFTTIEELHQGEALSAARKRKRI